MKYKNILLLIFLFFSFFCYSQTIFDYQRAIREANAFSMGKKYVEALNKCELALSYGKDIDVGILKYNAACMASMAELDSIGFLYLNQCFEDGFILIDKCKADKDLCFLRLKTDSWENSMKILGEEMDFLTKKTNSIVEFCKKNPLKLNQLIPYRDGNGKWGYMMKESHEKIVDPIFDLVDFFGENSSIVFYKTNEYKLDKNGLRYFNETDFKPKEDSWVMEIDLADNNPKLKENENYSPQYIKYVKKCQMKDSINFFIGPAEKAVILEDYYGLLVSAVIKDSVKNRHLLINHRGEFILNFSEKYIEIERTQSSIYPIKGRLKNGKWQLIDSLGKGVRNMDFDSSETISRTQSVDYNSDGSVWKNKSFSFSHYAILYSNKNAIIYNKFDPMFKPIIGKYKKVYTVNSPYEKNYRVTGEKLEEDYFLVEDFSGKVYFIDEQGNQYK